MSWRRVINNDSRSHKFAIRTVGLLSEAHQAMEAATEFVDKESNSVNASAHALSELADLGRRAKRVLSSYSRTYLPNRDMPIPLQDRETLQVVGGTKNGRKRTRLYYSRSVFDDYHKDDNSSCTESCSDSVSDSSFAISSSSGSWLSSSGSYFCFSESTSCSDDSDSTACGSRSDSHSASDSSSSDSTASSSSDSSDRNCIGVCHSHLSDSASRSVSASSSSSATSACVTKDNTDEWRRTLLSILDSISNIIEVKKLGCEDDASRAKHLQDIDNARQLAARKLAKKAIDDHALEIISIACKELSARENGQQTHETCMANMWSRISQVTNIPSIPLLQDLINIDTTLHRLDKDTPQSEVLSNDKCAQVITISRESLLQEDKKEEEEKQEKVEEFEEKKEEKEPELLISAVNMFGKLLEDVDKEREEQLVSEVDDLVMKDDSNNLAQQTTARDMFAPQSSDVEDTDYSKMWNQCVFTQK